MAKQQTVEIPEALHELLSKQVFATLTTLRADGSPTSNPVAYVWDGNCIRISSLKSRMKSKNIGRDPRFAFCVMSFENPMSYIEIRGDATVEDDIDRQFIKEQFLNSLGEEPAEDMDGPGEIRVVITLRPTKVSAPVQYGGKFDM